MPFARPPPVAMTAAHLLLLLLLLLPSNAQQSVVKQQSSGVEAAATAAAAKVAASAAAAEAAAAGPSSLGVEALAAAPGAAATAPPLAAKAAAAASATAAATAAADAADAAADAAAAEAVDRLLKGRVSLPLTYASILSILPNLERRYPHLIKLRDAAEAFGLEDDMSQLTCGPATCRVPYVELGLRSELNRSTPAVFYSGLVHGDEVVGPTAAVYLVALLASEFATNEEVFYMLSHRLLVVFPFFNSWGFARETRVERGLDPNRDFPYLNPGCYSAATSRLVAAAFERYLFIGGITWHGGMRAIGRPWGSFDHSERVRGGFRSKPAPDDVAFAALGKWLQVAGGPSATEYSSHLLSAHFLTLQKRRREQQVREWQEHHRRRSGLLASIEMDAEEGSGIDRLPPYFYYPEGPISDLVYPVNGGLEDWAYSAAFQPSPMPISACILHRGRLRHGAAPRFAAASRPSAEEETQNPRRRLASPSALWDFFNFWEPQRIIAPKAEEIQFDKSAARCAMFLIETHDDKNPPRKEYGTLPISLTASPALNDGLIVRNVRMAFKLAEKVQPDVLVLASPGGYQAPGCIANFAVSPVGCDTLDSLRFVAKQGRCRDFVQKAKRPLPKGLSGKFAADNHEVYEVTPAWQAAPTLNDEPILQRSCYSLSPWRAREGAAFQPPYKSWNPQRHEIFSAFTKAERESLDFIRFKIPPETPSGEICILLLGTFDKSWTEKAAKADPPLPPQSWLVASRKETTTARAPKGPGILKGGREWIFPTRSPAYPGNASPVGFSLQIREDAIEGFVSVALPLPTAAAAAAAELRVSMTVGGFLSDDPVFFNPYSGYLLPLKQGSGIRPLVLPSPAATKSAADVLLHIHPKLSQLPEGLLVVQIEPRYPVYSSSSSSSSSSGGGTSSSTVVHVATVVTGKAMQQQQQQLLLLQQTDVLLQTDEEVRIRLWNSVSRLLGQRVVVSWLPAGSAAAAAAAAAAAVVAAGAGASAAAPLAGSQHVPLLSDQVNEDFNNFLREKQPAAAEGGLSNGDTLLGTPTLSPNAALWGVSPLFFPYTRSFTCLFSPSSPLPDVAPAAALGVSGRKRLLAHATNRQGGKNAPPLQGSLEVTSVWTRHHEGLTSFVGEFTVAKETDLPLLLQFPEECCPDLLLHQKAKGWAVLATFSTKICACGPGTVVTAALLPASSSSSSSSSSGSSNVAADELLGAEVYTATAEATAAAVAAAAAASGIGPSYGVYLESPGQRQRVLLQLQQQQKQQRGLTAEQVAATVRRAAGVQGHASRLWPLGFGGSEVSLGMSKEDKASAAAGTSATFFSPLVWGLLGLSSLLLLVSAVLALRRFGVCGSLAAFVCRGFGCCRSQPSYEALGARPAETAEIVDAATCAQDGRETQCTP